MVEYTFAHYRISIKSNFINALEQVVSQIMKTVDFFGKREICLKSALTALYLFAIPKFLGFTKQRLFYIKY